MTATWTTGPLRVFQHLLREVDAIGLDPASLIEEAEAMGANAYIAMGGGFSAWYPTQIAAQAVNPHLSSDFLGKVIERAREQDMRILIRMDISKGRAGAETLNPDWYVRTPDGRHATVWSMPQVCPTGPFWEEATFAIVDELLARYPTDGFFFNYFHVPRCFCSRCRAIVQSETGEDVPAPDARAPAYERWRQQRLASYAERLRDFIAVRQPEAILVPYHHVHDGWDTARMADIAGLISGQTSNPVVPNPVDPQPMWNHWAAEEALVARALKPAVAPFLIQSTSAFFASRQTALPAARLIHNLVQTAAHGAGTAPSINGLTTRQDDPRAMAALARTGAYLAANAEWYRGLTSLARILIVRSEPSLHWGPDAGRLAGNSARPGHVAEFRGLYEMLAALRYPVDLAVAGRLDGAALSRYDLVVLPAVSCLDDTDANAVDAYVAGGGTLLATADTGARDRDGAPRDRPPLACLPALPGAADDSAGAYLAVLANSLRTALGDVPHIGVTGDFWRPVAAGVAGWERDLALIGPFANNAPEFTVVEGPGTDPGLLSRRHGAGRVHWLPWRPGALYHRHGIADYRDVIGHLATNAVGRAPVALPVGEAVDAILYGHPHGALLHLNNGAAVAGRPLVECTPLAGFDIHVAFPAAQAILLNTGTPLAVDKAAGGVMIALPRLDNFAAIALVRKAQ